MDLYREARGYPYRLLGAGRVRSTGQLGDAGLSKGARQWRARHGALRREHQGTYLLGAEPPDLLDRARAALAVCPMGTVIGYQSAALLHGFGVVESPDEVHVVVPAGSLFPQRPGIVVHQSVVPIGPPHVVRGVPCTAPVRTALDLARVLPRALGLPVLDAALATLAVTQDDLTREVKLHYGLRGIVKARELVRLADQRPECKQESQLRLILHDAGIRGYEPQVGVAGRSGAVRYWLDLGNRRRKIAAEYDGSSHLDRVRLRIDRRRHNWLEAQGWRMRYFTDEDLYRRPGTIIDTLRAI